MPKIVDHAQRRDQIALVACRVVAAHGFERASMVRIAREAGYTTGMLAHYFDSKQDIIIAALRLILRRIDERLRKVIADPAVTVAVKVASGNQVFIVGKVNRPGQYPMNRPLDVMQVLSLAGGATPFASLNDIRVLRREGARQVSIPFHYAQVESGRHLDQNILLKGGDTVVVP